MAQQGTQAMRDDNAGGGVELKMLFCQRCDNLLYPHTDDDNQLRWRCTACENTEEHNEAPLVYALEMKRELSDIKQLELLANFAQDPTVKITRERPCPKCGLDRVAEFINPLELPVEDMSLFFACTTRTCRHVWKDERKQKRK